ncbi:MAG: aminopeptidase N [Legionellaceae bacterium]|nr:aminopeptidase N [Legionellaceae bacterium]HCA89268.1 aminopeptidase N [Legionellales bacterium]|tara:strand:- start:3917 stop:6487 length:2571 start_codon:yes stop_codon:yes gene_type:complete
MTNKTIYLKDYQPFNFAIDSIHLHVDLNQTHTDVTNTMQLRRLRPGALHLNGEKLKLLSLALDGQTLEASRYAFEQEDLILNDCPDTLTLTIKTRIYPHKNTALSGLYCMDDLFCTQCEAEGFRRITYYPDRPDVLSVFTTTIIADKAHYPVLLSNGNLIAKGDIDTDKHWVTWHDPFKKPAYLFALVAGKLGYVEDTFITQSQRQVMLRIYVEPGNEAQCNYAMQALKKAMRWDEVVYRREYDLDIFMIVAVSNFNMGAMENKGLNIFNAQYILASPQTATDEDFANIESVVAHEYFHNWTGNRVTCRDWFQLSLKEGLTVFRDQEFSRDMNSREVNRIYDVKALRTQQFPEDAGLLAHPVRPNAYQKIDNFYTATVYNKGAEVIRMQHTLLGETGFQQGMDTYFARHDGQAVTIDDFVSAMSDSNQVDLTQFCLWYEQAGTPIVEVISDFDDHTLTLTLTQSCPQPPTAKKPFHIPIRVSLFTQSGERLPVASDILQLRKPTQTFCFTDLPEKPLVSLLGDFSAPIKLQFAQSDDELLGVLRFETDGYAKWQAMQTLSLKTIHAFIDKKTNAIPPKLLQSFAAILADDALDLALKAELLTPPSFEEVIADLTDIAVVEVEHARDRYHICLNDALRKPLLATYKSLDLGETNSLEAHAFKVRHLKNVCLRLLMMQPDASIMQLCQTQLEQAGNMTDKLSAFKLLNHHTDNHVRQQAIDFFYTTCAQDKLVFNKWLSAQALSSAPNTLKNVQDLTNHPEFSWTNPNKVRALIGAFTHNPRHFHEIHGSGYQFLTACLLRLDAINPQIAARLATPFTRFARFNATHQRLIKQHLNYLACQTLSRDLAEVVNKSLGRV